MMKDEQAGVDRPPSSAPHQPAGWKSWIRQVLGVGVSLICLVLVFRRVDFDALKLALSDFRWHFLVIGLVSLAVDYSARIERWKVMLRAAGANVRTRQCIAPFLGSIALNNVLPLRAGDLVRALVFPSAIGVSRVTATASLVFERLIDLLTLLLSLGIGLLISPMPLPEWIGKTVIIVAIVGVAGLAVIVVFGRSLISMLEWIARRFERTPALARLIRLAASLIEQLSTMGSLRTMVHVLLLSVIVWAGEAGLFWAMFRGLEMHADYASSLMVMAIATLSTLVPSSPGYVGPFHLAAFAAVRALGGTEAQAASFAVLAHLSLWLPTTVAGGIAILLNPKLFAARARSSVS
ncbi:lysylphosphatidylglycerol synthase transmembrane domain-containing protein [Caballeronia eucalypticola]|uniref:lysylphosphatidylglycerol synthase transmembrane domain-containing protein n=1 Tax=Caballeronia sp. 15715 TaxID=3391030 RepID=UPI0039E23BF4